jgi:YD repeat-containing protein
MSEVAGLTVRGPVRTCRHEVSEWDRERETWRTPQFLTIVTFRPDGQVSEGEHHNPDGSIARWAHAYDDEGRLTEVRSWTEDGPRSSVFHAYDQAGRSTGSIHVAPDGTRREVEICNYDGAGRKTKTLFLPDPGTLDPGTLVVGYGVGDDSDDTDEAVFYDANQRLIHRVVRSRDQDGRLFSLVVHFGGETPFPDFQGALDKVPPEERAKMATLVGQLFADRTLARTDYAYDEKGRLLERTMRMGGLSEHRTTFRYNDHDDPTDEISEDHSRGASMDSDGVVHTSDERSQAHHTRFDYHYDEYGNWTEQVVWSRIDSNSDFQRSNVIRRTITYY